jgi:hypothetical protein
MRNTRLAVLAVTVIALFATYGRGAETKPAEGKAKGNADAKSPDATGDKALVTSEKHRFYVKAEALLLTRTGGVDDTALIRSDNATVSWPAFTPADLASLADDPTLVDTGDLGFRGKWRATPKLTFGYALKEHEVIEASYFGFGLLSWESSRAFSSPPNSSFLFGGNLYSPFEGMTIPGAANFNFADFFLGNYIRADYESRMNHNAELSYRRELVHGDSFLAGSGFQAGIRYVNVEEEFSLVGTTHSVGTGGPGFASISTNLAGTYLSAYQIRTTNHMLGGQAGGNLTLNPHRKVELDLSAKVALMANMICKKDRLRYNDDIFFTPVFTGSSVNETGFSLLGEVGLRATGNITERISVHGGYQALILTGVALAPNQIDYSRARKDRHDIGQSGVPIYHGVNLGFTVKF